jgi:hypothetical protein
LNIKNAVAKIYIETMDKIRGVGGRMGEIKSSE